jgi:ATP-dependent Clp protease ATP-binding subunit ClpA
MDLKEFLSRSASRPLVEALERARAAATRSDLSVHLAHLVDHLLDDETVRSRVPDDARLKAKADLARQIQGFVPAAETLKGRFAFRLSELCAASLQLAKDSAAEQVSPLTFLATCIADGARLDATSIATVERLRAAGITIESLLPGRVEAARRADFTYKSLGFGVDLTAMARAGFWSSNPLVGSARELRRLTVLMSSNSDSVVLVGEPGVGKSALVQGLAWHLANRTRSFIPPAMDHWTIVMISPANLLADTGGRGELEARLDKMLAYLREHPDVIPFFDEIHTLLDTNDPSARAIATAIKPPMVSSQFRCIGATTDKEYARFIACDEALNSRFFKLLLPEPTVEETRTILKGVIGQITPPRAREVGLQTPDDAVTEVVRITQTYQREDRQPRKAIRLMRQVLTERAFEAISSTEPQEKLSRVVTPADVARVFSENSGIPVDELDPERPLFYQRLGEKLGQRVRGQSAAVSAVVSWLSLQARGWMGAGRPRGRFLFLGPSGVGKSELAKQLAGFVMHDRGSMITKNMAEYQGEGARTKFMGSDPGYVGFGQIPTVYSQVMMRKYSVVVLDEFEKADPSLANPLLSILDGQAEDSQARRVDFSQCIFVLTSNSLQDTLYPVVGDEEIRRRLIASGGIWQPALVDRIDQVVRFNPLDLQALGEILDLQISDLRGHATHGLPAPLDLNETRAQILAWATEGEVGSARRLERALVRWLAQYNGVHEPEAQSQELDSVGTA